MLRWMIALSACALLWSVPLSAQPPDDSPWVINLGDYARGDGTDETAAIQAAFDAIPPVDYREHVTADHPGGVLYIPRPPVAYCISDTIRVIEKWNTTIRCATPVLGSRGMSVNHYFRWTGPDDGLMFEFRSCKGMRVENLSMTGMDAVDLDRIAEEYDREPIGRHTSGVTGIVFGPIDRQAGFQTSMVFDQLRIANVAVGMKLGDFPNNGPDVRELHFRGSVIGPFSQVGIWARSGNLANTTFDGLSTSANSTAEASIRIDGGEILVMNWNGSSREGSTGAEVVINAGGIHIIKAWSEFWGPFLKTSMAAPEWTEGTYGSVNYPIILEGVRHYDGGFLAQMRETGDNPVPTSIIYNRPVPLHLIGCSLWGSVELGAECMAPVIDYGTVFINRDAPGFVGEGITRYHRLISVGSRHPENARIVEPYFVDRRHVPGTAPPTDGVWQAGDGIINTAPDPDVPERACRGWVCVEAGEPGAWVAYGPLMSN